MTLQRALDLHTTRCTALLAPPDAHAPSNGVQSKGPHVWINSLQLNAAAMLQQRVYVFDYAKMKSPCAPDSRLTFQTEQVRLLMLHLY
jgi:hypothetical protein